MSLYPFNFIFFGKTYTKRTIEFTEEKIFNNYLCIYSDPHLTCIGEMKKNVNSIDKCKFF